jgi:hypothetical protein
MTAIVSFQRTGSITLTRTPRAWCRSSTGSKHGWTPVELVEAVAWSDEMGLSDRMNIERLRGRFPAADRDVLQQMYLLRKCVLWV